MDSVKDIILQKKNVVYIKNTLGKDIWIQVCGHKDINGADAGFWCGLVAPEHLYELYNDVSWQISAINQSVPGFEGCGTEYTYKSNLLREGLESILYYREFYGVKPNYIEISQEFVLLNNLRFDSISNSYWAMYDNGESEEAVKYLDNTTILIKNKFLRQYSAAKQMAFVIFFDIRAKADGRLADYELEEFTTEFKDENVFYGLWGGDNNYPQYTYSVLMGKKIMKPAPIEECGYWPYEKEETYGEFIIGIDDSGREKTFTCNPDKLNNYFGANPEAPMYLTPVFFKKEVLQKYINKPELYEIGDGYLDCKSLWRLEIDNHHKNCVCAYLGDLGRDLPESEREYWRSFNIIGEEKLSMVSFQRDFLNMSAESNMADHQFQFLYRSITRQWEEKYGWPLFLSLAEDDQYNISNIRIPTTNSQPEFDQLVLSLVKVLIDSLNEKKLMVHAGEEKDLKGIGKLKNWLNNNGAVNYEDHIQFLKDLQELRSTGTGHRKGRSYDKISRKFGLGDKNKIDAFEEILRKAVCFLNYMQETFIQ